MFINKYKNKIVFLMIFSIIMSLFFDVNIFAGEWTNYGKGIYTYKDENGYYVKNEWRWIDSDNDSIAECYRFDKDGFLLSTGSAPDGKKVNQYGQWVQDGIVQKIYFNNFIPLKQNSKTFVFEKDISTYSGTRRINATNKDLDKLAKSKTSNNKKSKAKTQYASPMIATLNIVDHMIKSYTYVERKPQIDSITGQIITAKPKDEYDDTRYSSSSNSYKLYGINMKTKVSASKNYVADVESANIYGGDKWEHCMCLEGNEAFIKVTLDKMNYMRVEVAHQTHGASTADTECYLELYIDDELIDSYDTFVDGEPLVIEEWFDEEEKTFKLRWVVTSGSQGRKLYLRDGRLNKVRD